MSLLATVSFDLSDGSRTTLHQALTELSRLGLASSLEGSKGLVALPKRTVAGIFPGRGVEAASILQQRLTNEISDRFLIFGIRGSIFVTVADQWSWHYRPIPRSKDSGRLQRGSGESSSARHVAIPAIN